VRESELTFRHEIGPQVLLVCEKDFSSSDGENSEGEEDEEEGTDGEGEDGVGL